MADKLTPQQRADLINKIRSSGLSVQKAQPVPANYFQRSIANPKDTALSAPIEAAQFIGETIDPYTGAPVRAAVGGAMEPGTLKQKATKAASRGAEQVKAAVQGQGVLPTTPSGEDIVYKGVKGAGMPEEYARTTAEVTGPFAGAAMDLSNLTVGAPVLTKTLGAVPKVAKALGAEEAGMAVAKQVFKQAGAEVGPAMKATRNLKATEQFAPALSGAKKYSYENLQHLREWNAANPIVVPGSGKTADAIAEGLYASKDKALSAPNVKGMADKLKGLIQTEQGIPKDLTVAQLDELISNVDSMSYTPAGNQRQIQSLLKPEIKGTRQLLSQELGKVPEGKALLDARSYSGDVLATMKEKGKPKGLVGKALSKTPILGEIIVSPSTAHRAVGAARLPAQAAEKMGEVAAKYPKTTEFMLRDAALAPGRVEGNYPDYETQSVEGPTPTIYVKRKK